MFRGVQQDSSILFLSQFWFFNAQPRLINSFHSPLNTLDDDTVDDDDDDDDDNDDDNDDDDDNNSDNDNDNDDNL